MCHCEDLVHKRGKTIGTSLKWYHLKTLRPIRFILGWFLERKNYFFIKYSFSLRKISPSLTSFWEGDLFTRKAMVNKCYCDTLFLTLFVTPMTLEMVHKEQKELGCFKKLSSELGLWWWSKRRVSMNFFVIGLLQTRVKVEKIISHKIMSC